MPPANNDASWLPYDGQSLSCTPHNLHLWRIDLNQPEQHLKHLLSLLSAFEQARAKAFYTDALRRRFIVRRAALRYILSMYLDVLPGDIRYEVSLHGKPHLPDKLLHFNLSHSQNKALIGVAQHPIGVDIEHVVPINDMALVASRHFTQREQADLFSLADDQQLPAFYRCWTRKEAFIKADGAGLSIPLNSFDVTLTPDAPVLLRRIDLPDYNVNEWQLTGLRLPTADNLIGAVATQGRFDHTTRWSFSDWFINQR